jgi:cysteine synthase A
MSAATLLGEAAGRHDEAAWSRHAIALIQNDQRRSADTHLLKLYLPAFEGIDI